MSRAIDPASVRAYVARDWRALRASKRVYWRARLDRGGLAEALAITGQLRAGLQHRDATWPTEHDREEDLQTHRRVAAALARTAPTTAPGKAPRARGRARRVR
ncbi:MAG TPA: hypothetical protein VGD37_30080 [Kofleriaceae bacterium]|jgi:hypothetical protein